MQDAYVDQQFEEGVVFSADPDDEEGDAWDDRIILEVCFHSCLRVFDYMSPGIP